MIDGRNVVVSALLVDGSSVLATTKAAAMATTATTGSATTMTSTATETAATAGAVANYPTTCRDDTICSRIVDLSIIVEVKG